MMDNTEDQRDAIILDLVKTSYAKEAQSAQTVEQLWAIINSKEETNRTLKRQVQEAQSESEEWERLYEEAKASVNEIGGNI